MTVTSHVATTEHLLLLIVARQQVLLPQRRPVLVHRVHPLTCCLAPVAGLRLLGKRGAGGGYGLVEALLLLLGELHEV